MVLFTPDGRELVRLPGEVEPERYQEILSLGLVANRPAKAVLADAYGATFWYALGLVLVALVVATIALPRSKPELPQGTPEPDEAPSAPLVLTH